jgi:hypothetical protein
MVRRRLALGLTSALLLAGCGGSTNATTQATSTSTPAPSTTTMQATVAPATTTTAAPAGTATTPAKTAPTTTATHTSTSAPSSGPADVAPATFVIRPGGALSPSTVSTVASVPIELTVVSGDGKAHRVLLSSPTPHALSIPARRRASVLVTGLRAGRYRISVDGVARGVLVVGFMPGP